MEDDRENQEIASNPPISELPAVLRPFARWLLPASAVPPIFPPPAVYFVVKGGDLTYVGQSIALDTRLASHTLGGKGWDTFWWWPVAAQALDDLERLLIRVLAPPLNLREDPPDMERAEVIAKAAGIGSVPAPDRRPGHLWRPAEVADLDRVWPVLSRQGKEFLAALAEDAPVVMGTFSQRLHARGAMPYLTRVFRRQAKSRSPVHFEGQGRRRKLWLDVSVAARVVELGAAE